jgi:hypothetical protein
VLSNIADFEHFKFHIRHSRTPGKTFTRANITRFVEGENASLIACVTGNGIVVCPLQRQLVDIPEVIPASGNYGVYVGNEWGNLFSAEADADAARQTRLLGENMYARGYRGIFGVDVVVNANNTVTVIECNSRYTSVFPMLTMLHKQTDLLPLDALHLSEFLGLQLQSNFDELTNHYRAPLQGAQLILHNRNKHTVELTGNMKAGVYAFGNKALDKGGVQYLRPGHELADLKTDTEMVLTDGLVFKGGTIKPGQKVGRLLFRDRISDQGGTLKATVRLAVNSLYEAMQLRKVNADKLSRPWNIRDSCV